jgi:hypothetical protein
MPARPSHHGGAAATAPAADPDNPCHACGANAEIIYKLGLLGNDRCRAAIDAYNECIQGRTVSVVWACRGIYKASQACMDK